MLIRGRDLKYVNAVAEALGNRTLDLEQTTNRCPECWQVLGSLDNDLHLVLLVNDDDPHSDVVAVIGCEGYWVVRPAAVGVDSPTWQDWRVS